MKSVTSNSSFTSTVPDKVNARVRGCTDPKAENYNSLAQDNDGSCIYKVVEEIKVEEEVEEEEPAIKGCMDASALNYNRNATVDNGTCKYKGRVDTITKNYYVWSATASIKYKQNGNIKTVKGVEYDSFNITHDKSTFKFIGDVREVPKPVKTKSTRMYSVENTLGSRTKSRAIFFRRNGPQTVSYKDAIGNTKTSSNLLPGDTTTICAQQGSISKVPGIVCIELGPCVTQQPKPKPPVVVIKPKPPKPIEIFTELEDIKVRGSGFDDEYVMENIDGTATVVVGPNGRAQGGLPGDLVGGTGDISQGGGIYGPIRITQPTPTRSGGGESNRKDIERLSGNVVLTKNRTPRNR